MTFAIFYGISTIVTVKTSSDPLDSGRTFPYIITGILLCLSMILILNCIKNIYKTPNFKRKYTCLMNKYEVLRLITYLGALSAYVIGFIYVGYIVSTTIYLSFLLFFMNSKNRLAAALITIITPFVLWLFFTKAMEVQFPESLLI